MSLTPDLLLLIHQCPGKEAIPNIELKFPDVDILYFYGLAHIDCKEWLEENPDRQVVFLEDRLERFKSLIFTDHPRVHFKWISSSWDRLLEECARSFPREKIEVIPVKKSPHFRKIRLQLMRKSILWHSVVSETISSHLLYKNIIPNLLRIPNTSYVNAWEQQYKNCPIIICGAGPSLKKSAPALKRLQDQAIVIGCGSALSALSHLGIRPHLGIAIDPNAREYDCLSGCTYRDLPLLFGARLYPKVFELFDGPFGYIRSGSGSALESYVEEECGLKQPPLGCDLGREALSVTTLAISLAHFWGCNPIILAGVDLAYDQGIHYVEGVPVSVNEAQEKLLRRKNKQGKWVATLTKWVMEQHTIDQFAKKHPQKTFINASGGLGFKSIRDQPLESIQLPSVNISMDRVFAESKMEVSFDQIDVIFQKLIQSLNRCQLLIELLEREKGGKAVLYEYELEEELAYKLLLRAPRSEFERLQPTTPWHYLSEVLVTIRAELIAESPHANA
jgi:hypothetical protein